MGEYNMEGGIRRQVNRHACTDVRYLVVVCTYIHLSTCVHNEFEVFFYFWLHVPFLVTRYPGTCTPVPFLCTKGAI